MLPITNRINRYLFFAALGLGLLAVVGDPYAGAEVSIDTDELAWIVENEVDHVTAEELADRLIRGDVGFRLLDLRDSLAYREYHIPGAENVSITGLGDYPLLRNEEIILYSNGGIHSAQAWFLLKAKEYRQVYMLLDGLTAWKEDVLFPALPAGASAEQLSDFARRVSVAEHFGGSPRDGAGATDDQPAAVPMPQVQMPSGPVVVPTQKRRKEGC